MVKLRTQICGMIFLLALAMHAPAYTVQYADKARTARLRWKPDTIHLELSNSLKTTSPLVKTIDPQGIDAAVDRALQHWKDIAGVDFDVKWTDQTDVSPAGARGDGVSLITVADTADNILFFDGEPETAAKTRIFFTGKGQITEGDIVLNPYQMFSDDGTAGTFDLESVLTHEVGHLLGLGHSDVTGTTMQGHHSKNGIYGMPVSALRTLSDDDIAGARTLYGANAGAENCCGAINGKLILGREKLAVGMQVWLEEIPTGRIVAETVTDLNGVWAIEGLTAAKYNIFVQSGPDQDQLKVRKYYSAEPLGDVTVANGKAAQFERTISLKPRRFSLDLIGFGSQLSTLAVPMNSGKTYSIYFAGKTLPADGLKVFSSSPFITVVAGSVRGSKEFDAGLTAYTADVTIAADAPAGEYSLRLQSSSGDALYQVGAISVDNDTINANVRYLPNF
jgi:hypothetical protein